MRKCLIGVDWQIDFISGSLTVNGGAEAVSKLVERLFNENDLKHNYNDVYLTLDWHPMNHVSFKTWAAHCVQHSIGAAIYPSLMDILPTLPNCSIHKLTKGTVESKEEYSVFNNYFSGNVLSRLLEVNRYDEIHVCGLAGDYCVLETLKSLIELGYKDKIVLLMDCIASIDDGTILNDFIKKNKLTTSVAHG